MGLETVCRASLNGHVAEGRAHCGDGELDFQGEFRIRWAWKDLAQVEARAGVLRAVRGSDIAEFHLNDLAEKWAQAIRNPKSRLDKLGLKPSHRYRVEGEFDPAFAGELADRAGEPAPNRLDAIFVRLDSDADLDRLLAARGKIVSNGMIWAIWPKGRKAFREDDIRNFALAHGLVDVKVASFSNELSALKLVIPVAMR